MNDTRRAWLLRATALLLASGIASAANGQAAYPTKPVTLIVPYGPGGATDVVARALADALRKLTEQPFTVENRPGANGAIALEAISRAPKDGSTVLVGNPATSSVLPLLLAKKSRVELPLPVARIATVPGVLVASKNFPPNTVPEMVTYVKAQSGKVSYASAGNGSMAHLSFLALAEQASLDMIHVPYKGGAQAMTDNIAGLVQLNFLNLASAMPLLKDGRLKALAVSGTSRTEQLPNVPTLAELGYEGALSPNWQGLLVPAGTPAPVVEQLAALVARALQTPELRAQLAAAQIAPSGSASPKEFAAFIGRETAEFKALIGKHGIEFE